MAFISESTNLAVPANTETIVYDGTANGGVPAASGAVLIGLHAANIGTVTSNVDLYKRTSSGTLGTDDIYIVKGAQVPVGSSLDALPSKLVLNQTDKIFCKATVANTIQVTASLLENS